MHVALLFTLLACLTNPGDAGRHQGCPEDWTLVNTKCYKFVEEDVIRYTAASRCSRRYTASLALIENKEENKAVQDLIHGQRFAWIGLHRRWDSKRFKWGDSNELGFANWWRPLRSDYKTCAVILDSGYWQPKSCLDKIPYVCWKRPDCEPGWFGDECERQCHCYLGHDCMDEPCPYGCEPGWYGERCDTRYQQQSAVSFYCMKQKEGGYSLMVSLGRPSIFHQRIGVVNAEGEISPNCSSDRLERHNRREIRLNVHIQNVSGVLEANCPAETVADGILQWTLRFQKEEGVESFEDEELQVQCDLSEADAAYDVERVVIQDIRKRTLTTATQTGVSVRTYLADPGTLEPATNLSLGVPVRLVVTLPEVVLQI
ncbi:uncharacterized protein LOC124134616 isoform X2 [Haliotis rufescens]|uniref:uncharacterized protein LOC124134616 isoform X2 n=1 Tax=Haliotis rufescens TaxID=6454 RepID=UPI00201FB1EC|nr:uncharacterized protein LOC124134616 isoform X2 [Haliotis rufescens]